MGKVIKKLIIISFVLFSIASWLLLGAIVVYLSNEVAKLDYSNREVWLKLDTLSDDTNALWEERVFEKEMKENLAYHLPEGFNSVVKYTGLIPLDFGIGLARVSFIHRGKSYSVDFSYQTNKKGLQVERISNVIQLTE